MTLFYISRAFFEQAHADGSAESSGGKSLNLFYISRAFPECRRHGAEGSAGSGHVGSPALQHVRSQHAVRDQGQHVLES